MKLTVTKQKIILGDKLFNLNDIDFLMLDKKIRLYKSNGTTAVLNGGFDYNECVDTFLDIAFLVAKINKNFIVVNNRVINLANIRSLETCKSGVIISTEGFELRLTDLSKACMAELTQKFSEINTKAKVAL